MQWIHPNFKQITEFNGYTDDCGPCANEVALACVQSRDPSVARMNQIRQRDLNAGIFHSGSGQNIYDLVDDVRRFESGVAVNLYPLVPNYDNPDCGGVVDALKAALLRKNVCVLNIGKAGLLPGNQKNVQWHFVTVGGVSDTKFLVANGDEIPQDLSPNWVTRDDLIAAYPIGFVEYITKAGTIKMAIPQGWNDDGKTLMAPNSNTLSGGIRWFVLNVPGGWNPDNVPLEPIHGDDSNGYHCMFKFCQVGWDPKNFGYYEPIGQETLTLRKEVTDLQKQIADNQPTQVQKDAVQILKSFKSVLSEV